MTAFLTDGTVSLRPVTRADLPQLAAWRNDPELRARTREVRPLTEFDQERWHARISDEHRRDFMFVVSITGPEVPNPVPAFAGTHLATIPLRDRPVGVVGLCHWDPVNGSAEVSFYIGDESARGKGYGGRAVTMLVRWGFTALRLHRIWAEVFAFNEPSIKLLLGLGFKHEGTLREHVFRGGRFVDAHLYGALYEDTVPKGTAYYGPGVPGYGEPPAGEGEEPRE